jgi:hypothetical protein
MAKSKRPVSKAKSTPAKGKQTPKRKERSIGLTIVLVLIMVHSILTAFAYVRFTNNPTSSITPWIVTALFIAAVAKFVAAVAIWKWERWGITLFLGATLVDVAVGILLTGTTLIAFNEILPVAILAWLVRDRMQDFK